MGWLWCLLTSGAVWYAITRNGLVKQERRAYANLNKCYKLQSDECEKYRRNLQLAQEELKTAVATANEQINRLKDQNRLTVENSDALLDAAGKERAEVDEIVITLREVAERYNRERLEMQETFQKQLKDNETLGNQLVELGKRLRGKISPKNIPLIQTETSS